MGIESLAAFTPHGALNAVVETPRGSAIKIKFDQQAGVFALSRPLPAGVVYPFDWGFVPGTRAADGDPVDIMLPWDCTGYPGLLVPCRAVGLLRVEQNSADGRSRQRNDRLLGVPQTAARLARVGTAADLGERLLKELEAFFIAAVQFEQKDPRVLGWGGPEEAEAFVRSSLR